MGTLFGFPWRHAEKNLLIVDLRYYLWIKRNKSAAIKLLWHHWILLIFFAKLLKILKLWNSQRSKLVRFYKSILKRTHGITSRKLTFSTSKMNLYNERNNCNSLYSTFFNIYEVYNIFVCKTVFNYHFYIEIDKWNKVKNSTKVNSYKKN